MKKSTELMQRKAKFLQQVRAMGINMVKGSYIHTKCKYINVFTFGMYVWTLYQCIYIWYVCMDPLPMYLHLVCMYGPFTNVFTFGMYVWTLYHIDSHCPNLLKKFRLPLHQFG